MTEMEMFKINMRYYRESFGWSQQQLANKLKVSRPVISRLESGEQVPDLIYLLTMSQVFGIRPDQLLGVAERSNDRLHEMNEQYEVKQQSQLIDYLFKQTKLTTSLQKLLHLKVKDRKIIEDMLILTIEKSIKLAE